MGLKVTRKKTFISITEVVSCIAYKEKKTRKRLEKNKTKKQLSKKAAYGNAVLFLEPAYSFISLERYSQILFLKPLWLWEMHGRGGISDLSVGARRTHPALLLWVPGPAPTAARRSKGETTGLAETPDKNMSIHTWMHLLRLFKSCNFRSTLGPKIWQCIKRKIKLWRFILFPLNSTVNTAEALVLLLLIPSIINRLQNLGWFIIILNTVIFAAFHMCRKQYVHFQLPFT